MSVISEAYDTVFEGRPGGPLNDRPWTDKDGIIRSSVDNKPYDLGKLHEYNRTTAPKQGFKQYTVGDVGKHKQALAGNPNLKGSYKATEAWDDILEEAEDYMNMLPIRARKYLERKEKEKVKPEETPREDDKDLNEALGQFLDIEDVAMELSYSYAKSAEIKAARSANDHRNASTSSAKRAELYKTYGRPDTTNELMKDSEKEHNISYKRNRQQAKFKSYAANKR